VGLLTKIKIMQKKVLGHFKVFKELKFIVVVLVGKMHVMVTVLADAFHSQAESLIQTIA